ncbi:MAG: tRNA uridine-5-carboxymethylaminomethyl(34) synthesis enzyme MnmG [Clostridiales bacterium]|nr:tRNA uridine-5-carboxymethylaminomethyl(34) synthesis enzyme MnmG [Clostridiales bacterium]
MQYFAGEYDVIVIGAGHAGSEAALACARMGMKTMVTTINLDSIALMACNPSLGGPSKGNLVREIDSLGGEMGLNIDATMIQIRELNTKKGPAVRALRAQADKKKYSLRMKKVLEDEDNLYIKETEICEILTKDKKVSGVITNLGAIFHCKAVIVAAGVFLNGKIVIGDISYEGGPNGLFPAKKLTGSLENLGFEIRRFKTGTPARINMKTVDFDKMIEQPGDERVQCFSFMTKGLKLEQRSCWLTYTNEKTHNIIKENLHRSPLYTGGVEGVGVRYCPSIETKIVTFPDKNTHQIFIEPEGLDTNEMYVQGMSSSLPEDVQREMMKTVPGIENAHMMRTAYAIDYDCINSTQLKLSLEAKHIKGLFFAGQINGSSGYEEAAAQGLMAGINAVLGIRGEEPFILHRSEAYIGVLIDDLVTKGTNEPYRMMTSRAEYRLILRQDNADMRLTEKGYKIGLVTEERYKSFINKKKNIENELERLKNTTIGANTNVKEYLKRCESAEIKSGISLYELLKRPEITYLSFKEIDDNMPPLTFGEAEAIEILVKYEGYIKKQIQQIEQFKKMENKKLTNEIDYKSIRGLSMEAKQKLSDIKPESIGQASRISGVSPADISVLLVYLEQMRRS